MRDYGKVSPQFWIGETGKQLRGDANAQVLALYLMTCPHSTMTGVFHCPVLYMAHETGMGLEGATKALARLSEVGFCEYDEASETVFVLRMAAYQIGESLKPTDNRVAGLRKEIERMPETRAKSRFLAVYGVAFGLVEQGKKARGSKAPPKPLRSQEQEQEQEQERKPLSGKPDHAPTDPDSPEGLIGYLNAKAGKRFRPVEANARLVRARLAEATADEIRRVIDARCAKWRGDPKMAEYLRPSTLFGREKFAQYLGEIDAPSATKDAKWWVQRGYGDEAMARRDGHVPPWEEAA